MPAAAARRPDRAIDRWIDRAFAIASDDAAASEAPGRLRVFERLLLLHLVVRIGTGSFPVDEVGGTLHAALTAWLSAALALSFVARLAPLAVAGALCAMLVLLQATFPGTGNHFYLELWTLILLLVVGRRTPDEAVLLQSAVRWSIVIVLFYTGLQKLLHGTYYDARFLMFQVATKPEFEAVFSLLLPADELARVQALDPRVVGAGPFRTQAPWMLLASNAVVLFELVVPFALLCRRTRRAGVVAVLIFAVAIQLGAREVYFAGLLVNTCLLFWPTDLHRAAAPLFVGYYALIAALQLGWPGTVVLR